ncbi:MAG: hypothetical protein KJ630_24775 [Proteobacteria bacterium]|nr:hypothetical protein [Pseudomonadota bacterium]
MLLEFTTDQKLKRELGVRKSIFAFTRYSKINIHFLILSCFGQQCVKMLISSSVFIANGLFDLDLSGDTLVNMLFSGLSNWFCVGTVCSRE